MERCLTGIELSKSQNMNTQAAQALQAIMSYQWTLGAKDATLLFVY